MLRWHSGPIAADSSRGCVTPNVIAHIQEASGGDVGLVDGYEELDVEEYKEKIKKALEQGHVDDKDWKGVREALDRREG